MSNLKKSRTRELEAALSVATEALKKILDGGVPLGVPANVVDRTIAMCDLAREALSDPDIQKEAERIRAMEELLSRQFIGGYPKGPKRKRRY